MVNINLCIRNYWIRNFFRAFLHSFKDIIMVGGCWPPLITTARNIGKTTWYSKQFTTLYYCHCFCNNDGVSGENSIKGEEVVVVVVVEKDDDDNNNDVAATITARPLSESSVRALSVHDVSMLPSLLASDGVTAPASASSSSSSWWSSTTGGGGCVLSSSFSLS